MATFDTSMPPDTGRSPRLGAYDIRQLASSIQEIENVDHYWPKTGNQVTHTNKGKHRRAIFTVVFAGANFVAKMLAALTNGELGYENNSGDSVVQVTRSGNVNLDASVIANNTAVKADNNAGDGTVDLIKLTTGDVAQLPDKSVLAGSTAPTADAGIANKKYVDDQLPDDDAFGNWASKTVNTVYQAATDGLVVGYKEGGGSTQTLYVKTDGSNPPTTVRLKRQSAYGINFCCPVKKDDYWKVETSDGTTVVFWMPIGG